MDKQQINFDKVPVPDGLDSKQQERAIKYVTGTVLEGLTITETLEKYGISSGTMYNEHHLKNPVFENYIQRLTAECVSTDDIADFHIIAGKIKQNALKSGATRADYELYLKTYSWLEEYVKQTKMQELGINKGGMADTRTVEEKKAVLLSRLKG